MDSRAPAIKIKVIVLFLLLIFHATTYASGDPAAVLLFTFEILAYFIAFILIILQHKKKIQLFIIFLFSVMGSWIVGISIPFSKYKLAIFMVNLLLLSLVYALIWRNGKKGL